MEDTLTADGPERRAILISSIHARRVRHDLIPALALLQEQGLPVFGVYPLRDLEEVTGIVRAARARGITLVIAAGGDGTVGAVVNAIAGTDMTLGVLPLGTSNDFARSLDLPLGVEEACAVLVNGTPILVDLGLMTDTDGARRYFVHAAIVGVNTLFARKASSASWRRRYGRLAYPLAAWQALRDRRLMEVDIHEDGAQFSAKVVQVGVLNAPNFAGPLNLRLQDGDLSDHRLDLLVIGDLRINHLLQSLRVLIGHRVRKVPYTYVSHPYTVRIETAIPQEVACDGELVTCTPVTLESAPLALRVLVRKEERG